MLGEFRNEASGVCSCILPSVSGKSSKLTLHIARRMLPVHSVRPLSADNEARDAIEEGG